MGKDDKRSRNVGLGLGAGAAAVIAIVALLGLLVFGLIYLGSALIGYLISQSDLP